MCFIDNSCELIDPMSIVHLRLAQVNKSYHKSSLQYTRTKCTEDCTPTFSKEKMHSLKVLQKAACPLLPCSNLLQCIGFVASAGFKRTRRPPPTHSAISDKAEGHPALFPFF